MADALPPDTVQQAQRHGAELVALLQSSTGDKAMLTSYQQRIEQIERETALAELEAIVASTADIVSALAPTMMSVPSSRGPILVFGIVEFQKLASRLPDGSTTVSQTGFTFNCYRGSKGRAIVAALTAAGELRLVRGMLIVDDSVDHIPTAAPFGTNKDGRRPSGTEFSVDNQRSGFFRRFAAHGMGLREYPLPASTYRALACGLAWHLARAHERAQKQHVAVSARVRAANLPSLSG